MASPEPPDDERFFEALARRGPPHAGADDLRAALVAEARTLREAEAEAAHAGEISPAEWARLERVKAQLFAAGVFAAPSASPSSSPAAASAPKPRRSVWRIVRDACFGAGGGWSMAAMGSAFAVLVLGTVLVLRLGLPGAPDPLDDPLRGEATGVLVVPDAAARAGQLEAELQAAGAQVVAVQVNALEWALHVEVPQPDRRPAVQAVLDRAGLPQSGAPPYELTVRQRP